MNWLMRFQKKPVQVNVEEQQELLNEIRIAHHEWIIAHNRLDWALEADCIDYSIYALEAAEKRYEMLLRLAKRNVWENIPLSLGRGS